MDYTTSAICPTKSASEDTCSVYIVCSKFECAPLESNLAIFVQTHQTSALDKRGDVYFLAPDSRGTPRVCLWRANTIFSEAKPMHDNPMSIGTTSTQYSPEIWHETLQKLVTPEFSQQDETASLAFQSGIQRLHISHWIEKAKHALTDAGLFHPLPCTSMDFPDNKSVRKIEVTG